jgi:hypothetical protein
MIERTGVFNSSFSVASDTIRPTVLYISSHEGTSMDLGYVFEELQVPHKWVKPKLPYLVTKELAKADWEKNGIHYCALFDFIIVGDTVPRARGFIENRCKDSQIILQATQRFDQGMVKAQRAEWIDLLRQASQEMTNVRVIENNPYESWYMKYVRNAMFFNATMIRPSGRWPSKNLISVATFNHSHEHLNAVVRQHYIPYLDEMLVGNLSRLQIPFVELRHKHYGGAQGLASYRCVIVFPYQVSVMALYENLAAGVNLLVPSLGFYKSLAPRLRANGVGLFLSDLKVLQRKPNGWKSIEWFNDYFKDVLIHYDSWNHLRELVLNKKDFKEHSEKVKSFMKKHTRQVLQQWDSVLQCRPKCD